MDEALVRQGEKGKGSDSLQNPDFSLSLRFVTPYIKILGFISTAESYSKEYNFECSLIQSFPKYAQVEHVFHEMEGNVPALK
jgi:hypothetical protein